MNPLYPTSIDTYPNAGSGILSGYDIQPYHVSNLYDIVSGVEQVVGLNPKNGFSSVTARITGIESGYFNLSTNSTTNVSEGNNKYFTNARVASAITANAPLSISSSGILSGKFASSSESGFLLSTDWSTFNNKVDAGSNLGAGSGVFAQKSSTTLQFKSLVSGNNINITADANTITISSIAGGTGTINSALSPLFIAGSVISGQLASSAQSGFLTSADWNTFNNKSNVSMTSGNLTSSTPGVSITNGTNAVLGGGTSVNIQVATASQSGLLASGDWGTFNNKVSTATNLGAGTGVFASLNGTTLQFKSLLTGTNISFTQDANTITINAAAVAASANTFNAPLVLNGTVVSGKFASSTESGFLLNADWTTFNNKLSNASNLGAGTGVFSSLVGTTAQFKSLVSGNNINITSDANTITISSLSTAGATNSFNAPLILNGTVVSGNFASSTESGFLKSADWNTFNNKQTLIASGNLSSSTPGVTIVGGNNTQMGQSTSISIQVATSSQSGILGSGDWSTFNNKVSNGTNLGLGTGVFASLNGTNLQFKSLVSGNNINIVSDANTITISALATAGATNSFNAPLALNGTIVSGKFASASESGFLLSADWRTFNSGLQTSGGNLNGNLVMAGNLVLSGNQTIASNNILKVNTISDNGQTLTVNPTGSLVVTNNYFSMNSNTGFDINGNGGTPGNIVSLGTLNLTSTQLMQLSSKNNLTMFATGVIQLSAVTGINTQGTIAPLGSGVDGIGTASLPFKNLYADNIYIRSVGVATSGSTGTTNSFIAPLVLNGTIVSGKFASSTDSGFLNSADWNTFNNKQTLINSGNLTTATPGITITGGINVQMGGNTSIDIQVATSSQSGLLSPTDWTTFNSKQTTITANAPLALSAGGVLSGKFASATESGFLLNADWNTFNGKVSNGSNLGAGTGVFASLSSTTLQFKSLVSGNNINIISDANTITISALATAGATNSFNAPLVLNGTVVSGKFASASESGFLSNTDWTTFNSGYQKSGGPLSGSITYPTSGVFNIGTIASPANGIFANTISGNAIYQMGIPVQNDFGYERSTLYVPNTSTTMTNFGLNLTTFGTVSHPSQTELLPYAANFATTANSGTSAGMNEGNSIWYRGSTAGANGFNFFARVIVPDTTNAYQSGVIAFVGMTNSNGPTPVSGISPVMHAAGFQFVYNVSGIKNGNWFFFCKDLVTPFSGSTNIPFSGGHVYDMFISCPPQSATISWRLDNRTLGLTSIGSNSLNLPGASTALAGYAALQTYSQTPLNIRVARMKVNSNSF